MQFKHPELLYALILLLIPIIIHLFQLRKFQKESFTNVAFLKEITLQTRKSSQLKKWLTLLTRLLLLAAIIVAFAQPYFAKSNDFKAKKETVIYLDNSFSMQAKGAHGELLKRAVQDIIITIPEDEEISLITNTDTYKNTTVKSIKNELLQLNYVSNQLSYEAALLKSKTLFSRNSNSIKDLIFISDFQQKESGFTLDDDSLTNVRIVKLIPVSAANVSIDSLYISKSTASNLELQVLLKNIGTPIENLPISLYDGSNLLAKTTVTISTEASTTFSLPVNTAINGKISIDNVNLQFDNSLFFNINATSKINVFSINTADDTFLNRIFTNDEFNYTSTTIAQLNYNAIDKQHLIILNELNTIPNSLAPVLKAFTNNGGHILVIPSNDINLQTYNSLLLNYGFSNFTPITENEKRITTINYSHPLYNDGVFEKRVTNFQFPKVESYYGLTSNSTSPLLQFEDGNYFLFQNQNVFVFSSALNEENSNFKNSPLIVPTIYNIGKASLKTPKLYYTIGQENTFDVALELQQDDILSLNNESVSIIPQQQYFNNKISITTNETPLLAGIYSINNKDQTIKNVSYNYNRDESNLIYQDLSLLNSNAIISNSITEVFDALKSDSKVNELWKWFVIFAMVFLIIEMLILKYFK